MSRRGKGGYGELQKLVELNRSDWEKREEKRSKIQADTQLQVTRIQAESQERLMGMQLQMQREDREAQRERDERDREIQRERDERQLQMVQSIVASLVQVVNTRPV